MNPEVDFFAFPERTYPTLLRRWQAAFIDNIIAFVLVSGLMAACNNINENNGWLKGIALLIGLSYEPLMSRYAVTIGKWLLGLRLSSEAPNKKLTLAACYLRYVIKLVLGWISMLSIGGKNVQKRALHDFAAGTVITYSAIS